jgi:2-oxoisovalerate dehydrogenase E2 component (dihydrolipoyl transacylase)
MRSTEPSAGDAMTNTIGKSSTAQVFRLPDVGEGLTEAEIVTWRIAVGDRVEVNAVLVDIETAKSLVELPSPYAGRVADLLVAEGETVPVGAPIVAIETGDGPSAVLIEPQENGASPEPAPSVLVGYGPSETRTSRRRRPAAAAAPEPAPAAAAPEPAQEARVERPRATPPVRMQAKKLGIDLAEVAGTGPAGSVTRADLQRHADARTPPAADGVDAADAVDTVPTPPPPTLGDTRIPVRGVRKMTAAAMTASAFTAPHVTEFKTVDVTRAVRIVDQLRSAAEMEGARVTFLLLAARAVASAVRRYPDINASWDEQAQEIVLHHRLNLGIAAATPRGLLVPNVKDAGSLSLPELARALGQLVSTAREGRTQPEHMAGGTFTITNIGVFGIDAATPILNPGEAAILCLGAVRETPWVHKGKVVARWTTQLALSFDHRLVDGELGSRVLAHIAAYLQNPKHAALLG